MVLNDQNIIENLPTNTKSTQSTCKMEAVLATEFSNMWINPASLVKENTHSFAAMAHDTPRYRGLVEAHAHRLRQYVSSTRGGDGSLILPPALLCDVIERNQMLGVVERTDFFQTSDLVARSVQAFPQELNLDLFYRLTEERKCPFLSPSFDAPVLLLAECQLRLRQGQQHPQDDKNCYYEGSLLSDLQIRCIESITTYFKTFYKGLAHLDVLDTITTANSRDISKNNGEQANLLPCSSDTRLFTFLRRLPMSVLVAMISRSCVEVSINGEESLEELVSCLFGLIRWKVMELPGGRGGSCSPAATTSSTNSTKSSSSFAVSSCSHSSLAQQQKDKDDPMGLFFLDKMDMEEFYLDDDDASDGVDLHAPPPIKYIYVLNGVARKPTETLMNEKPDDSLW